MTATGERHAADLGGWGLLADAIAVIADVTAERDAARRAFLDASAVADAYSAERADWYRAGWMAGRDAARAGVARSLTRYLARTAEYLDHDFRSPDPSLWRSHGTLDALRYPAHDGRPAGRVYWLACNLGAVYHDWAALADLDAEGGRQ